jgi:hypothetical protein
VDEGRPRTWEDLNRSEARELLDEYVAAHPDRLADFFDEVRRRGGPVDAMDFSRESLRVLWEWVLTTQTPSHASDDQETVDRLWERSALLN